MGFNLFNFVARQFFSPSLKVKWFSFTNERDP